MKLLAFETSTEACSVALSVGGEVRQRFELAPRRHAELVLPMADALLAEAGLSPRDLDGVAFGRGPGSFTGVRIAAAVAQGVAFAVDLPVAPVSTLQALAQGVAREPDVEAVLALLDARMREVYWGAYRRAAGGEMEPLLAEALSPPEQVRLPPGPRWVAAGEGWQAYAETLRPALGEAVVRALPDRYPGAAEVARLGAEVLRRGAGVPAAAAVPVYLRDRVVRV